MLSPPLQQVALGVQEGFIVLLENDLAPGQGDIRNGHLPGGNACPLQVALGDGVGLVDVDGVVVVGLKADGGNGPGHLLEILPHPVGQKGLVNHLPCPEVVQGGAVGQNHRRVDGYVAGVGGEVGAGAAGGHSEGAPSRVK